jgi:Xaa-Pro dipeptidase
VRSNVRSPLAGCSVAQSPDHIVGEFPHARIPGDKDHYRISPANTQRMRDPDAAGHIKCWIIEVHLVDLARTFGGFYERLLQPAEMK